MERVLQSIPVQVSRKYVYDLLKCKTFESCSRNGDLKSRKSEQSNMSIPLSTHILDTSIGKPAKNVVVLLYKMTTDSRWKLIGKGNTNEDGRCSGFTDTEPFAPRLYKLHFSVEEYFKILKVDSIYPYVEVVFKMDSQHHHIPLLLNPYGYSTYKGS